ncbi:MAG: fused MFS/spermidine synthase [Acidobacteriota bacterium]|nr:fused MFS/spermidine synthase [Acidobacteriota bacterium]
MHIGSRRLSLTLSSSAFFISGFAALTYQIVWQRLLVLPIGADVYSTTIIVAAFMAGLGIGSLVGGHVADRLSTLQCVLLFIGAELAVAAFGFASRWVFYDWMYLRLGPASLATTATAAILFLSLLWPTFWMGISLPVLSRAVTSGLAGAARRVGLLYGFNTLGAAAGAFATTWLLFPWLGLESSVHLAAGLNALAVIAVLPIALAAARGELASADHEDDERGESVSAVGGGERWPVLAWIALYGIAGFQALSLEIIWFRLLGVAMKSSAFTFGTLLTIYLTGLGVGAAAGSLLLRKVRSPGRTFLLLQAFVGLYAGLSVAALVNLLPSASLMPGLWAYLGGYEPLDAVSAFARLRAGESGASVSQFIRLYVLLPVALVIPPTLAMGASFPLLQKVALVDPDLIGRRVAQVLLANIAGSTVGSIVTGWFALTYLGSAGSLKVMMMLGGVYLALAVVAARGRTRTPRVITALVVLIAVGVATARLPAGRQLWAALHGTPPQRVLEAEDATGLSLIKSVGSGAMVFVNGIGQSWIPYGNVHTVLGALPAFLHPNPRRAAIIGLGSGDTLYALAGRPELSRITSIEIIEPQLATLQDWARRTGEPALLALLSDPRIEHVSGDGRTFVMRSGQRFDIIEADALRPGSAYSGNLYSVGYFQLLRSRLAPGGIAVTWAPTSRVHDTFAAVFPHVLSFGDILVGSDSPITFDADQVRARLRTPEVQAYYRRAGIDIESLLARYLAAPVQVTTAAGNQQQVDLNEDLFPRDEFSAPRARIKQ